MLIRIQSDGPPFLSRNSLVCDPEPQKGVNKSVSSQKSCPTLSHTWRFHLVFISLAEFVIAVIVFTWNFGWLSSTIFNQVSPDCYFPEYIIWNLLNRVLSVPKLWKQMDACELNSAAHLLETLSACETYLHESFIWTFQTFFSCSEHLP